MERGQFAKSDFERDRHAIPSVPSVSFSIGEALFTNDPRAGIGSVIGSVVRRAHSYQMVVMKTILGTDLRVTLGPEFPDRQRLHGPDH